MDGGTSITTGAGTITLRSDGASGGDIVAEVLSTQNAVVTINSGEDVILQNTITTRRGNVDIDAVLSVSRLAAAVISTRATANDQNSGTVDIDAGTSVSLAGGINTSGFGGNSSGGLVTIDTLNGSITTAAINAAGTGAGAGANILLTAVGQNSDIQVNGALNTNTAGLVTLTADDSIRIAAGGSITTVAGAVLLRANAAVTAVEEVVLTISLAVVFPTTVSRVIDSPFPDSCVSSSRFPAAGSYRNGVVQGNTISNCRVFPGPVRFPVAQVNVPLKTSVLSAPRLSANFMLNPATERVVVEA